MPAYRRGLENASEGGGGVARANRKKNLWLSDGDQAKFWFVTEGSDAVIADVHLVQIKARSGKQFPIDVLCMAPEPCRNCDEGAQGPFERWFFWVYIESIAHPTHDDPAWKVAKVGQKAVYVEEVNDIWLFVPKFKLSRQVKEAYATFGTMLDRRWKLSHTGTGGASQDIMVPETEGDPMPVPDYVLAAVAAAPDLNAYVEEQFSPRSQQRGSAQGGQQQVATAAAASAREEVDPNDLVKW